MEFELDMGFAVSDVVRGLEKVLGARGASWERSEGPGGSVVLRTEIDREATALEIQPMPADRIEPLTVPPRTLLRIRSGAPAAALDSLRCEILVAFLRTGG